MRRTIQGVVGALVAAAALLLSAPAQAQSNCGRGVANFPACLEEFVIVVETPYATREFRGSYVEAFLGAVRYVENSAVMSPAQRRGGVMALGGLEDMLLDELAERVFGGWRVSCKFRWPTFCKVRVRF